MSIHALVHICLAAVLAVLLAGCDGVAEGRLTRRATQNQGGATMEKATFGAGCFWGVEAAVGQVEGVTSTAVGYSGGHFDNPTYKDVCSGKTGHIEVVQVDYDPSVIPYDDLLDVFWSCHDPTQRDRQGPDVGVQYRSAIFYHTPEQRAAAEASKERLGESDRYERPIATRIEPASTVWRAEEYHQKYLEKQGRKTCRY